MNVIVEMLLNLVTKADVPTLFLVETKHIPHMYFRHPHSLTHWILLLFHMFEGEMNSFPQS